MKAHDLDKLRIELSIKAKNGVDFVLAATLIWLAIAFIWTQPFSIYNRSVLTFIIGGIMLPVAGLFSKILKTNWKLKDNPLQVLGLWLNFTQLFYFPILVFLLIKNPEYFILGYAVITGAHLFPYAWLYKKISYAVMAGFMVIGVMFTGLFSNIENLFLIPLFMGCSLLILSFLLFLPKKRFF